jgi:hypothetical protein
MRSHLREGKVAPSSRRMLDQGIKRKGKRVEGSEELLYVNEDV